MKVTVIFRNNISGKTYDMTNITTSVTLENFIEKNAGSAKVTYLDYDPAMAFPEGSVVSVSIDGKEYFRGYVFESSETHRGDTVEIIAYDSLIYLKNRDTYIFQNKTVSQVFSQVCTDFEIPFAVTKQTSYILPEKIHDDSAISEMLEWAFSRHLISTGQWLYCKDVSGVLTLADVADGKTDLVIGEESLLTDYTFSRSIKDDTYNQIKLVQENAETEKRDVYIARDVNTIKTWGLLQYYEKVDENSNEAQIEERMDMLLKVKNRPTHKLKLPCLGDLRAWAGNGVAININKMVRYGLEKYAQFIVTSSSHTFTKDLHTMTVEVQLDI